MENKRKPFQHGDIDFVFEALVPAQDRVKKRQRRSKLDQYQVFILEKYDEGWSYSRILVHLQHHFGVTVVSPSTVLRKIQNWTK